MTRPAKAKRAPERDALAEAIEASDAAAERLRVANDALSEFNGKLAETRSRHYAADDHLGEAREALKEALRRHGGDETAAVADALCQGRCPPREAVKQAEEAYTASKEAFDLGKEGEITFKGAKVAADDALRWAERKVQESAERVCWTLLPELAERAERARAEWLAAKSVLSRVADNFDGVHRNYGISDDPLARRIRNLALFEPGFNEIRAASDAACAPWQAAFKALLTDPDAPLPE